MKITINLAQEQAPQDIFQAGSLVVYEDVLVLVHYSNTDDTFSGTSLSDTVDWSVGEYHQEWDKTYFVKFLGNVLLEQE